VADKSLSQWKPIIDLKEPSHKLFGVHIVLTLQRRFAGKVDLQKEILLFLNQHDKITNGAAHAMIEALAKHGFLRIERWGPGGRYKRILTWRRFAADAAEATNLREELPWWAWEYYAGPPNHRMHLARHRMLARRFPERT
jgi:hypothetical protein